MKRGWRSGRVRTACLLVAVGCAGLSVASAEVVRVEVSRRALFAEGVGFGAAGPYEVIEGRMYLETDPGLPANARITDLRFAPRNARGRVEFWTDFYLLKPVDPARGSRRLLYDVNNRGNMLALWTLNGGERTNRPVSLAHVGNGFLMRQGVALFSCGWNGDVVDDRTGRLLMHAPVATDNGRTITGPTMVEFCTTEPVHSRAFSWSPWGIFAAYPPATPDHRLATLTMCERRGAPVVEIPHDRWAFGRGENGEPLPELTHLWLKDGFRPGWLYDLIYTAASPRVTGLGLAAIRDTISFLRHAPARGPAGENPLAGAVERVYALGISQSGRLLNHFVYEGFNADEAGRLVFDGLLIHAAGAGKGMFNHRFRMTTEWGAPHEGFYAASEFFPMSPAATEDPVTGQRGDTLERARAAGCVPKMMFTQTSSEYWTRAASLLHTDPAAQHDLELPPEVRLYWIAGSHHLGAGPTNPATCRQPRNPLDDRGPILRALFVALDEWVSRGVEPPASRYPRLADRTLITVEEFRRQFPRIPGVDLPAAAYEPRRLDFGPRFFTEGIADRIPPHVGPAWPVRVPAVDADGNEVGGVRLPDVEVPLGTYAGWNLRAPAHGVEGQLASSEGMFVGFASTPEERQARGDPRPSIRERYPTRELYLARIALAALQLRAERLLLDEDLARILEAASRRPLGDSR
ncbi:MAG: alpha/beta hydrolase domain-containing protein [Kiritimatiellae bacterium]|nr:alpha/beta hydrolase domain-containing protein [Kiritimatiellia bacterium]